MLDQIPMDGVVISSPHVLHHEHSVAALAKGCHLLVEKPLTTTAVDARDLIAKAAAAGKQVIVPYGWNFKDWTDEARALVANAVTVESEAIVAQAYLRLGGKLQRFQHYNGEPLSGFTGWRPRLPITQWEVTKR